MAIEARYAASATTIVVCKFLCIFFTNKYQLVHQVYNAKLKKSLFCKLATKKKVVTFSYKRGC